MAIRSLSGSSWRAPLAGCCHSKPHLPTEHSWWEGDIWSSVKKESRPLVVCPLTNVFHWSFSSTLKYYHNLAWFFSEHSSDHVVEPLLKFLLISILQYACVIILMRNFILYAIKIEFWASDLPLKPYFLNMLDIFYLIHTFTIWQQLERHSSFFLAILNAAFFTILHH